MMRSLRSGLWLSVFLVGAALPAFCQIIVPPNISGRTVPSDQAMATFEQSVFSTGSFDFSLVVFRDFQLKFVSSGIVATSGPLTTVTIDIPLASFGLAPGDVLTFLFTVHHRGTEGNTRSTVISIIPVVAPPPPPPPPTSSSAVPHPGGDTALRAARREDEALV